MILKNLFFDLDGTVVESSKGIIKGFRHTFDKLNYPQLSDDTLNTFIGPPLEDTFLALAKGDLDWAEKATTIYRQYYGDKGMLEAELYPGMLQALTHLQAQDYNLYIATSKKEDVAIKMLNSLGLDHHFRAIFGSTPQTPTKTLVLKHALNTTNSAAEHSVMIGDREYDIIGGQNNNVAKTIGVLWGFGGKLELENAGSDFIIQHPKELLEIVK